MKNAVFWDVTPLALVKTDVSEDRIASIIKVTRINELGERLAVTSNRRTLRKNTYFPTKRRFLQEPYGIKSQKTAFF
jgi:hypothetical protein